MKYVAAMTRGTLAAAAAAALIATTMVGADAAPASAINGGTDGGVVGGCNPATRPAAVQHQHQRDFPGAVIISRSRYATVSSVCNSISDTWAITNVDVYHFKTYNKAHDCAQYVRSWDAAGLRDWTYVGRGTC